MILHSSYPRQQIPENISLPEFIKQKSLKFGNRPAFIDGITGRSISYADFFESVSGAAGALSQLGLELNDRVLIFAPNCLEYPILLHAVTSLGAILTTCNPSATKDELSYQLADTQPKFVVTTGASLPNIEDIARTCPTVKDIIVIGKSHRQYMNFDDLLNGKDTQLEYPNIDTKEHVSIIPFSSGTTGPPKGVLLTHYNLLHLMQALIAVESSGMDPGNEVFINLVPYYHGYGMTLFMMFSLTMGVTNIVLPAFNLVQFLEIVQKYKATFLHVVPPIAVKLIMDPIVDKYDISSAHTLVCGAAPLDKKQTEDLIKKLGVKEVRQGYGMTELTIVVTMDPPGRAKSGSAGLIVANMTGKVVEIGSGKLMGPNQSGEICFKGPGLMKGYLNNPKATRETIDDEGWLHTGDIGYFDESGHVYVIDRLKELIKYNGLQVPPAELESHLLKHPNIADAAVIGVPDAKVGELPRAYVVVKPGQQMSPQDVHTFLKDKVAPYKRLRGGVMFRNIIPKSTSGKILRRELKKEVVNEKKSKL